MLKHAAETKKAACEKVLLALTNKTLGINLADIANCAPANEKSYEDSKVSDNAMIMAMREISKTAVPMPNIPEMDVMWSITDNLLAAINQNGEDVKASCDAAQKEAIEQIDIVRQ